MDKESAITEDEKKWWMCPKRRDVYNLLIKGKSIQDISVQLKKYPSSVIETISHPIFIGRLEKYLSRTFFNFQVNKVLGIDEVFKLYWDIIMGRQTIDGLDKDQASKHFVKLLSLQDRRPKILNPKQYNIIMNILQADSKKDEDLGREFGFGDLENERPNKHPQLDKGDENPDEQGDED